MEKVFRDAFNDMLKTENLDRRKKVINAMFHLCFNDEDETEFTRTGICSMRDVENELYLLWLGFCRDNKLEPSCLTSIVYLGTDPYYQYNSMADNVCNEKEEK